MCPSRTHLEIAFGIKNPYSFVRGCSQFDRHSPDPRWCLDGGLSSRQRTRLFVGIKESVHKPVVNTGKEVGACLAPGIFSNKLTEQESMGEVYKSGFLSENPLCTGEEEPS